jgi:hypothetical protein
MLGQGIKNNLERRILSTTAYTTGASSSKPSEISQHIPTMTSRLPVKTPKTYRLSFALSPNTCTISLIGITNSKNEWRRKRRKNRLKPEIVGSMNENSQRSFRLNAAPAL